MNILGRAGLIFLLMALTGCGSWVSHYGLKQTGSVVEFLYPDAQEPPKLTPTMTTLRLPVWFSDRRRSLRWSQRRPATPPRC